LGASSVEMRITSAMAWIWSAGDASVSRGRRSRRAQEHDPAA
jgi:hypothetical protein